MISLSKFNVLMDLRTALMEGFAPDINYKLKSSEYKTLLVVQMHDDKAMNWYSKKLGIEQGSFTYIVEKLEKKDLLKRVVVSSNSRSKKLVLTQEGVELAGTLARQFEEHLTNKTKLLDINESQQLSDCLASLETLYSQLVDKKENNK